MPIVFGRDSYEWLHVIYWRWRNAFGKWSENDNSGGYIDVGSDLRLADAARFGDGGISGLDGLSQPSRLESADNHKGEREERDGAGKSSVRVRPQFVPPSFIWLLSGVLIICTLFTAHLAGWSLWDSGRRSAGAFLLIGSTCCSAAAMFGLFCWPLVRNWLGV